MCGHSDHETNVVRIQLYYSYRLVRLRYPNNVTVVIIVLSSDDNHLGESGWWENGCSYDVASLDLSEIFAHCSLA